MKKVLKYIFWYVPILYLPCLLVLTLASDNDTAGSVLRIPDSIEFLLLLLYTVPVVCAFIEFGLTAGRAFDGKERSRGEKIFNTASVVVAALVLVSALLMEEYTGLALFLTAALMTLWIIGIIVFRKTRRAPDVFTKKSFWLCAAAIFVAASVVICFANAKERIGNKVDDTVPTYDLKEEIARLEVKISSEQRLNNFRLEQITVDTVDEKKHEESVVWIIGHHDDSEKECGFCYKISYDDFLKLYGVNDSYVVYNIIDDGKTPIVTDPPAWTIAGVYRIMYE